MIICQQDASTNPPKRDIVKMVLHQALPADGGAFTLLSVESILYEHNTRYSMVPAVPSRAAGFFHIENLYNLKKRGRKR